MEALQHAIMTSITFYHSISRKYHYVKYGMPKSARYDKIDTAFTTTKIPTVSFLTCALWKSGTLVPPKLVMSPPHLLPCITETSALFIVEASSFQIDFVFCHIHTDHIWLVFLHNVNFEHCVYLDDRFWSNTMGVGPTNWKIRAVRSSLQLFDIFTARWNAWVKAIIFLLLARTPGNFKVSGRHGKKPGRLALWVLSGLFDVLQQRQMIRKSNTLGRPYSGF